MIWSPKDDSRAIAWVLSCPFTSVPSCLIGFASAVSAPYALVCYPAWSSFIVVTPSVVWVGAAIGCNSGAMVSGASVRVAIVACIGSKDFNALALYAVISWDVEELYSTIFFSINGGTGEYLVKYTLVLFFPWVAFGVWIASISYGVFAFNNSMYGIFPFLFSHPRIFFRSTLNIVDDSLSPLNIKGFVTPCPNPFLKFS